MKTLTSPKSLWIIVCASDAFSQHRRATSATMRLSHSHNDPMPGRTALQLVTMSHRGNA
jgi:hypothetical protein